LGSGTRNDAGEVRGGAVELLGKLRGHLVREALNLNERRRFRPCRVRLAGCAGIVDAPDPDIRLFECGFGPGKNTGGVVVVFGNCLHGFWMKRRGDAGINFIGHLSNSHVGYGYDYARA